MDNITDLNAAREWAKRSREEQNIILTNVFCSNCHVTTIVDYTIEPDDYGILLKGKCKTCGKEVARLVENI